MEDEEDNDFTVRSMELCEEAPEAIASVEEALNAAPKLVGFGWLATTFIGEEGETIGAIVPIAPDGTINYVFLIDKPMLAGVIKQLQQLQPLVDAVVTREIYEKMTGDSGGDDERPLH